MLHNNNNNAAASRGAGGRWAVGVAGHLHDRKTQQWKSQPNKTFHCVRACACVRG